MTKRKTAKPKAEIKPGKPAEIIDQETQVTPVQELTTEQMDNTPIVPGTVIVDPSVDEAPVKEEPVVDHEAEDSDPHSADALNQGPEKKFDEKKEAKLADVGKTTKEPTRYGAGKETAADEIENPGDSRHYPPPAYGDPTGGKNEYPR